MTRRRCARPRSSSSRLEAERRIPFARPAGAPAQDAEQIKAFDPDLEEIIWVRPIAGG